MALLGGVDGEAPGVSDDVKRCWNAKEQNKVSPVLADGLSFVEASIEMPRFAAKACFLAPIELETRVS